MVVQLLRVQARATLQSDFAEQATVQATGDITCDPGQCYMQSARGTVATGTTGAIMISVCQIWCKVRSSLVYKVAPQVTVTVQ